MKHIIFLLIPLLFLSSCSFGKDSWQGAIYKGGDTSGKPQYSQIFNNFSSCKDWVLTNASKDDKYTCNENCSDMDENGVQQCQSVIRNWYMSEGTITFDSYKQ